MVRKLGTMLAALPLLMGAACSGTADAATIDVSLTEFDITPSASAPVGEPVTLKVRNDGQAPHSTAVEIDGKHYETGMLAAGESEDLALPALDGGSYLLWCTVPGHRESGMQADLVAGAEDGAQNGPSLSQEQMDDMHEAGIKAFPAKTSGSGGKVLRPKLENGVKVFELIAKEVRWEVSPGTFVEAYSYNGQIPGPEIRVHRGDRIKVIVYNELPESTAVHFHGLTIPNEMDGVPFLTQDPIVPYSSFTYSFTVKDEPGTHMYHSHHNATAQVGKGLLGAFIIEPTHRTWDVEQTMVLGDGELGYTLNGKGFPATAPLVAARGDRVLLRFMNEGQQIHPMHLHGFHFEVVARDGYPVPEPYRLDTLSVAPGERYDAIFVADQKGVWAFHCHILSHAESDHGMHGMVTAVIVG